MFGKKTFTAFPQFKAEKKPIKIGQEWKFVLTNVALLAFPVWFWMSVVMRLGLGTDYFFDVIFDQLGTKWWGNILLTFGVVFLPGVALAVCGMNYIQNRQNMAKILGVVAIILLGMGFLGALNRG